MTALQTNGIIEHFVILLCDRHLTIHIQLSPLQPENKQFGFIPEMGSSQLDMVIISMEADDSHRATQPPPALHPDMSNNI